jgi:glycosyltransferase involved in cell wall biosynthesis
LEHLKVAIGVAAIQDNPRYIIRYWPGIGFRGVPTKARVTPSRQICQRYELRLPRQESDNYFPMHPDPADPRMTQTVIALLGRKDEPTDAIEEYCRYLGEALRSHDFQFEIHRVLWEVDGWRNALKALQLQSANWRGAWALVQYTALAWSERGFPQKFLRVLRLLKSAGARVSVIFHDVEPYRGVRLIDSARRVVQVRTMRRALCLAELGICTVPPEKLSWVGKSAPRAEFVPVGPNLPIPATLPLRAEQNAITTIGVFSITGGESGARETRVILAAVRHAAQTVGKLRLSVFGRHAEVREADLRRGLADMPVELSVEGVLPNVQIVRRLCACDVLLFARGGISSRRGSALAGIACGLPVIAYSGSETAAPVTYAGVVLVTENNQAEMNSALVRVLSDAVYRAELASRSRAAYQAHFSWSVIAARFGALLKL